MQKLLFLALCLCFVSGCQQPKENSGESASSEEMNYASFGAIITDTEAMPVASLNTMEGDSVYTKLRGKIVDVCQAKGCWMKLDLGNNETVRVTFKDYGFFVPKDSKGKEVVIEGIAVRQITSVDELQHYAKDAGKTADEIAAITEPAQELAFEAVGVLLK